MRTFTGMNLRNSIKINPIFSLAEMVANIENINEVIGAYMEHAYTENRR